MSISLMKCHLALYTSTADVDKRILKYYSEEDKRTQAARAKAEYTILKAWWDRVLLDDNTLVSTYGVWVNETEPRGILLGGTMHTPSGHEEKLSALIQDYKETFLPDYDDDNIWWGEGEEPLEGYALEYVWVKFNVQHTVNDSGITRLGAARKHLSLNIDVDVSNDFYDEGGEDGLPF
jgi:hypothetical protein